MGAQVAAANRGAVVPASELVTLCALDKELYCKTFFPQTYRQKVPAFHLELWDRLERRGGRQVAVKVFRGGGKTTTLRTFTSKRIAYGTSRTILFTSASQEHAKTSLAWLRRAVEFNKQWTSIYGLRPGSKWTDEQIQIRHDVLGITVTVIAAGITGQIRGLNIDDYRPDLIVCDDPCTEENTGTPEQREKLARLFFGALAQSLTPSSECPDAKIVLLQTPLHQEDLVNMCEKDPSWVTISYGILDENEKSRWEERYPTEEVLKERQEYDQRGQLPLWLREKQCVVTSVSTAHFREEWLKYWDILPERMVTVMGIDPVPPPSDAQIQKGLERRDYEVLAVVGMHQGDFYLLDYRKSRGHQPDWTEAQFFELLDKWRPLKVQVEGVAYQRTLKWILEQGMKRRRRYVQIDAPTERRKKVHRIVQAFSGIASSGRFYIHPRMVDFKEQFISYPFTAHDDLLDAVAMGLGALEDLDIGEESEAFETKEERDFELYEWRTAP
ncbi:MAG: hypothetical protein JRI39_00355 [Deltaproteobacteria bacterium]|nr:hypothetical protein [Deltaproteobacteria bacterium]